MAFVPLQIGTLTAGRIGLGTWALGGGKDWSSAANETEAEKTICAALDVGINLIDTAAVYGNGEAERLLGRVIRGRRSCVILADKCGICLKNGRPDHDLRPTSIMAQCEDSLTRLQSDYIDLYQIHWPDPKVPLADALGALVRLKEQGKIRAIGVCNFSAQLLAQACRLTEIASVQNPLSLLDNSQQAVLNLCDKEQIAFLAYGALGGGILSGKYNKQPNFRRCDARRYFYKYYFGESFTDASRFALRVKELAARKQAPVSATALAWTLGCSGVSSVLFGARNIAQIQENIQAERLALAAPEREFLHG